MNAPIRTIVATLPGEGAVSYATSRANERRWPVPFQAIEPLAIFADAGVIVLSSVIATLLYGMENPSINYGKAVGAAIVVAAFFISLLKSRDLYRPAELIAFRNQIRAVASTWTAVFALLAASAAALDLGHEFSTGGAGLFVVLGLTSLIAHRAGTRKILVRGLGGRKFASRKIVLVTDQPKMSADGLEQMLVSQGFAVARRFMLPPPGASLKYRKKFSAHMVDCARNAEIDEIVVAADAARWPELRSLVGDLRILPFPVNFIPVGASAQVFRHPSHKLGGTVCVEIQRALMEPKDYAAKRTLDLAGAALALLSLAPLLIIAAVAIKLDSPGPILFRQQRCGFNGRRFTIRKFRTMRVLEDGPAVTQAVPADDRVTSVGKWLRRTSIDELPQLFNVLDGSMSLVGPRPHALAHESQFDKIVRNYAFRRRVKPGLTGWAQIHGCRGPTPNMETIERRVEYDLWYIDNWSLRLDVAILIRTPFEVLRARNAF
ncbi:undecaprenyl-phosphate glucose phosphotransferase [Rhodoblastus sp.]|jgi:putative colanic acid biosynthesis UDP-glucose lipid carrier transferase|uniref:undecaprenyl-phosphate glucose phosphotransferase n=1 Tax=Rhodoblastus sp. TaxID=1962975 RepID=UPI002602CB4B|nr:undecaprenyl-phosphate glucose phosphotransferase [Rhodoblastus sp.]